MGIVYALWHLPTGKFYIGSTFNLPMRTMTWQAKLRSRKLPKAFQAVVWDDPDEWVVVTIRQQEATNDQLAVLEHETIEHMRYYAPDNCLNRGKVARPHKRK